jgi:hypothetical protein
MKLEFVDVPPPVTIPANQLAVSLGLLHFLQPEKSDTQFRCAQCHTMQPGGSYLVWIPDSVRLGDPAWATAESCRQNWLNGHFTGWCVGCARKLGAASPARKAATYVSRELAPWWKKLWSR